MSNPAAGRKLAILVNLVAPYRLPIYQRLGERLRTSVFISGTERNRGAWDDASGRTGNLEIRRSRGFSIRYRVGGRAVYDEKYLHIPLGQIADLHRAAPDAVITTEMGARTLLALAYGSIFRIPVWVWWGGTMRTERDVGRARTLIRRLIARWASRWISYGTTSTEYLEAIGVPATRILQIQNCVDESLYQNGTRRPRTSDRPVLLYVGQMIRRKGVDSLLRAAALLRGEGRSFVLRLVGDGPEREAFESMAVDLGIAGDVEFLGGRAPHEMPAIYRAADLLVFPTHEDAWGLVVNEALWSGLPVVSSIYAGCARELLPPGRTFDPLDVEAFASTLGAWLDGEIGPGDPRPLKRCDEVSRMLLADLEAVLSGEAV